MKQLFLVITIGLFTCNKSVNAQLLKRLKDKAASATEAAVGNKINNKVNGTKKGGGTSAQEQETEPEQQADEISAPEIKSVSKFDFVAGNKVLYAENFSKHAVGELPLHWHTQSMGEVVEVEGREGKWLRMVPSGMYLSPKVSLSGNFTIEFDLIGKLPNTGWLPASFNFAMYDNGSGKSVFKYDHMISNKFAFNLSPRARLSDAGLITFENGSRKFNNDLTKVPGYFEKSANTTRISINVQGERIRVWVDKEKVYDLQDAMPKNAIFNQMQFSMGSTNYSKDQTAYYVSNIRLASGEADGRSKLITEGKLVTTAITFGVGSDVITEGSMPVIDEIAKAMNEASKMKIRITGHTDSDGDEKANLELSKKRAAAIKNILVKRYAISESRIETEGKGESTPAGSNDSADGKAVNRRVEFTRL